MFKKTFGFIFAVVIIAVATVVVYSVQNQHQSQMAGSTTTLPSISTPTKPQKDTTVKTYADATTGITFTYPEKITLTKEKGIAVLSHSIPYKNNGGCDMSGDTKIYDTLVDFKIQLELISGPKKLPYVDGNYSAGKLTGPWAYEGVEGCGYSTYAFPVSGNRTLIVTRDSIQPLSGVVALDIQREILKIPGAISKEDSDSIFESVLASFAVGK